MKNNPSLQNFIWLVPKDLAESVPAINPDELGEVVINAYDVLYHQSQDGATDKQADGLEFLMRRKQDYMIVWADEGTCFGYAMQWFAMSFTIFMTTVVNFRKMLKWRF